MSAPLPALVVGPITELRATEDYFGIYFPARFAITGRYFCSAHLSLMHSQAHRALTQSQLDRALRRARDTLVGLAIPTYGDMTFVWNDNRTLRRGYKNIMGICELAEKMWQVRNMICNFLGPAYREHRNDFHISFDRLEA